MALLRRLEALPSTLGLALGVDTEQVGRVITQQVRRYANRAFHLFGNHHRPTALLHSRNDVDQFAIGRQLEHERHLARAPPDPGDLFGTLRGELLVKTNQRLENHRNTSLPATSITPPRMTARKNIGVMFFGSL